MAYLLVTSLDVTSTASAKHITVTNNDNANGAPEKKPSACGLRTHNLEQNSTNRMENNVPVLVPALVLAELHALPTVRVPRVPRSYASKTMPEHNTTRNTNAPPRNAPWNLCSEPNLATHPRPLVTAATTTRPSSPPKPAHDMVTTILAATAAAATHAAIAAATTTTTPAASPHLT